MVPSFSCVDSALLGHEYGKLLGWLYVNKLPRWIGDFGGLDASIGWSLRWIGRDVSVDRADLVVLAMLMTLNYYFFCISSTRLFAGREVEFAFTKRCQEGEDNRHYVGYFSFVIYCY